MNRDYEQFPDDENGDAIWDMYSRGDNLSTAREFDFSVVFQTEEQALEFGFFLLSNKQKVSFSESDEDPDNPWEIAVHPTMPADYDSVNDYESLLEEHAEQYNGIIDGWGCFEQK